MKYSQQAKRDLDDATEYYLVQGGPELRRHFKQHMRKMFLMIKASPESNGFATGNRRSKASPIYPYTIYYTFSDGLITILRVWHHAQHRN